MNQDPGRVFKGKKMAGQYGNVTRKIQNLKLIKIRKRKKSSFDFWFCPWI